MQKKRPKESLILKTDRKPIRVGISVGDINGIGPEVIIKALRNTEILMDCTPIIYGSTKTLSFHKKAINDDLFNYQRVTDATDALDKKVNIVSCWRSEERRVGKECRSRWSR